MAKKKSLSHRSLAEQSLPSSRGSTNRVVSLAQCIVASSTFDWIITGVIVLQALALALEATPIISVGGNDDNHLLEQRTFRLIE